MRADGSGRMFDQIAGRYDLLNRLMSLGIDRSWRRKAVRAVSVDGLARPRLLDLATGTADLALELSARYPNAAVVGLDPSEAMLEVGRRKAATNGAVDLVSGDAQELDFEDGTFDGVTIAFGIRNVPDRPRALREMARVTRPGGRVVILELCEPPGGVLGWPAKLWVHHIVPRMGALLSGQREYRYLQQSIAAFPPPREFAALMEDCGLEVLSVEPLTLGSACLFVATPHEKAVSA